MSEYIEREAAIEMIKNDLPEQVRYYRQDAIECLECMPTADVVPKSEVEELNRECESLGKTVNEASELIRKLKGKVEEAKTEVARTFRKRMNEKMGKHTHLLGKEYVQRIMGEVEKELIGEEDA